MKKTENQKLRLEVESLREEVDMLKADLEDYRTGIVHQEVLWQRNLLAQFARHCRDWGVLPCRCADRADDVLREAKMNDCE